MNQSAIIKPRKKEPCEFLSTRTIGKITNTGLWFGFCLVTFWGDLGKAFLYGVVFGIVIWLRADKADPRVTPRTDAAITFSILGVLIVLILFFRVGAYPLITAFVALAFNVAVALSRLHAHKNF